MARWTSLIVISMAPWLNAQTPTAALWHTPVSGPAGEVVSASVLLDTDFEVLGWSYSVCPAAGIVNLLGASPGSTTETILFGGPPDFQSIEFSSGGVTDSVFICFAGCPPLPPGTDYELLDIDYEMTGSAGETGDVCFCELGTPAVPIAVTDVAGSTLEPSNDCSAALVTPCPQIISNRRIESLDVITRPGEPGRFDLVVDWGVETSTSGVVLDTTLIIEVGGSVVATEDQVAVSGSLACCEGSTCTEACGLWFTGSAFEPGQCMFSPEQGVCACHLPYTSTFTDVEIAEGVPVSVRVQPMSSGVVESITVDDEIVRLAPYFNRELLRMAWLPDPDVSGNVIGIAYFLVTASAVGHAVDFSFDLTAAVSGGTAGGQTEVEIKIPGGVDPCLTQDCDTVCMVPESNVQGRCVKQLCTLCTAAGDEALPSFAALLPGDSVTVDIIASADALPEPIQFDDAIDEVYSGFVAAANRTVRVSETRFLPSVVPGHVDIALAWRAETGGERPEDLSARFMVEVNGVVDSVVDSVTVISSTSTECSGGVVGYCSSWTVDGVMETGDCQFSDVQGICACGIDLITILPEIAAGPGDMVTVTIVPFYESMTEFFSADDSISLQIASAYVRGDVNADTIIGLVDAIVLLIGLFESGSLPCYDAADVDDDGVLGIGDPISLLLFLFQSAGPLPSPFPACGTDPTRDSIGCDLFSPCP